MVSAVSRVERGKCERCNGTCMACRLCRYNIHTTRLSHSNSRLSDKAVANGRAPYRYGIIERTRQWPITKVRT